MNNREIKMKQRQIKFHKNLWKNNIEKIISIIINDILHKQHLTPRNKKMKTSKTVYSTSLSNAHELQNLIVELQLFLWELSERKK